MAKGQYIGVNNVARKVKQPYIGVGSVARKVKSGYIGVNNVARQFFSGDTPVGDLEIGSSVYMNVNGTPTEFLVVHQGLPDATKYDSSCDGTWLLMKDIYEKRAWNKSAGAYSASSIHTYLNSTFLEMFDTDIQTFIKQVKIPCNNNSSTQGLSAKIFLLSGYEVGWTNGNVSGLAEEGACLNYFSGTSLADSKRIGYYDGTASAWWLRSIFNNGLTIVTFTVVSTGGKGSNMATSSLGVRPALILPSETLIDEKFNIIVE